ncbi:hypothetical protein V6N13_038909 [Hibiscus sabdariffa]
MIVSCFVDELVESAAMRDSHNSGGLRIWRWELHDYWKTPTPLGCFKINVDGAVDTSSDATVVGGVIRSSTGEWYFGFVRSIGCCSSLNTELWTILDGLPMLGG